MAIITRRRVVILLVAIVALGVLLWYAFHYWIIKNYWDLVYATPKEAALNVDKNFKFPDGFPPDPGEAGKKTIHGIDSDKDGVRDDVQRWIYAFVPNDVQKQRALRQMARFYQHGLADDFEIEVRKQNTVLMRKADQCKDRFFDDDLHGYREDIYLKAKTLNTYDRTLRYLENDAKHTYEEVTAPRQKYPEPCENR